MRLKLMAFCPFCVSVKGGDVDSILCHLRYYKCGTVGMSTERYRNLYGGSCGQKICCLEYHQAGLCRTAELKNARAKTKRTKKMRKRK